MNRKETREMFATIFNSYIDIKPYSNTKFKDATTEFYEEVVTELAEGTIKYYNGKLPRILEYLGDYFINDIDKITITNFTQYLKSKKSNPCNRTLNKYREIVVRIIKWKTKRHLIVNKLSHIAPDIEPIDEESISKIINYYYTNINHYHNKKYLLIIMLFLDTGVRLNELVNIETNMINLANRSIRLVTTKTKKKRTVFFTEQTYTIMLDFLQELDSSGKYLFPGSSSNPHIRTESIYRALVRLAKRLKLTGSVRPHLWRHTHAITYITNGGDLRSLQLQLGHTSINTTQMYLHMIEKERKNAYDSTFEGIYSSTALKNVVA